MATPKELSDRYLQLSDKYLRQAQDELNRGDLPQASEKAWGAAAEAMKALAVARGWNHKSHPLLRDIATHTYMEFGRPRLLDLFDMLEWAHFNYYEHRLEHDDVKRRVAQSRELIGLLEEIRNSPARRFTPANREQERRLQRLTQYHPDREADSALDIASLPPVEPEG